jgi:hypothetical protein
VAHEHKCAPALPLLPLQDQGGGLKKGALMAMQLGGMPTSRMQTQLLTSWLEVKLLAIFSDLPRGEPRISSALLAARHLQQPRTMPTARLATCMCAGKPAYSCIKAAL